MIVGSMEPGSNAHFSWCTSFAGCPSCTCTASSLLERFRLCLLFLPMSASLIKTLKNFAPPPVLARQLLLFHL
jgi:hypothetical protein